MVCQILVLCAASVAVSSISTASPLEVRKASYCESQGALWSLHMKWLILLPQFLVNLGMFPFQALHTVSESAESHNCQLSHRL